MMTVTATTSIALGDTGSQFLTAQLEDEVVFKGGKRCHGLGSWAKGPLKPAQSLGVDPLLSPTKIRFRV
jgi:hypothetical protein